MSAKRALITGGCGFIGTNLTARLLADGYDVRVLDVAAKEGLTDPRGVTYFKGDMSSREVFPYALDGVDTVYHLAWSTIPKTSNHDPAFDVATNVEGSLRLMDACVGRGVDRFVFLSSGGTVYGAPNSVPIPEDAPLEPLCSYGITKSAIEKYLALYRRLHGLDYAVIRPSNPYGPHQNPLGQVGTAVVFMYRTLKGLPIHIWGDGSVVRDYIYIDDLVDAAVRAAVTDFGEGPRVFNVGSGAGTSLLQLINEIAAVCGREPEVVFEPGRGFDAPANILDRSRAKEVLGWEPATGLSDGLSRMRDRLVNEYGL
jgi:UDP-glucose 4-epimerase